MFKNNLLKLREKMNENNIDLAVITDDDNLYYFTGYHDFLHMDFNRPTILLVPKDDESILITPLLAFDNAGYRLGYGGGYYDRTLAELRKHFSIFAIGAAYGCQKFESIPHDQFDQRLDAVVTEKGVHHISKD